MCQRKNLNVLVMCSILLLIDNTSGLRCWRCSSDASNSKFCGETLDLSQINEKQKRWSYVECTEKSPPELPNIENFIPKCKFLFELVSNEPVYSRSCYWEEVNVPANSCANQNYNPSFVKTVACNTCNEDGCNNKSISASKEKDKRNTSAVKVNNSAMCSILSNAIFVLFIIGTVISLH